MKYTKESIKYIWKNFFYVFPFAILPAIFFAVSVDDGAVRSVFEKLFAKNIGAWTFGELFRAISVLNFGSWQAIVSGILGIVLVVPCVALLLALIEKHFRIGKRTFNGMWGRLNNNFVSTCGYALLLLLLYEVWALLLSAFLFFVSRIDLLVLAYVLAGIVFVVLHILLLQAICATYLWLPCLQITGFRIFEALHYAHQLTEPIKRKLLFGQLSVLFGTEAVLGACALFLPNNGVVFLIAASVLYVMLLMVYCVRMQIAYFDRDQIERADLNTYYRR